MLNDAVSVRVRKIRTTSVGRSMTVFYGDRTSLDQDPHRIVAGLELENRVQALQEELQENRKRSVAATKGAVANLSEGDRKLLTHCVFWGGKSLSGSTDPMIPGRSWTEIAQEVGLKKMVAYHRFRRICRQLAKVLAAHETERVRIQDDLNRLLDF